MKVENRALSFLIVALVYVVATAVGVAVYAVMIVVCKSITREDCQLLPKGDKLAKSFHL